MTYQKYTARTVSSIYFVYLYLVFKFRVSCNIFIFTFLVVIQLSVLSVVILVVKSCEPSKTVSVFYLLSCLLFCVTSRMNQVLFQNKVGLIDEWFFCLAKVPRNFNRIRVFVQRFKIHCTANTTSNELNEKQNSLYYYLFYEIYFDYKHSTKLYFREKDGNSDNYICVTILSFFSQFLLDCSKITDIYPTHLTFVYMQLYINQ
ncbi:Hypothetical_protein [Hexamita inflata]|uniref:Hypothetical_protein n=1 Tax=Hexamita inflata TaxID=28002 RepID=A0AA86U9Y6_9EUKA|nr:Hypothetical protein HINF_LOCUS30797 [Hexamita inflata]